MRKKLTLTKKELLLLNKFQKYCLERLNDGKKKYKTSDFSVLQTQDTIAHIKEEIADLSNWLFILWCNIENYKEVHKNE